LGFLHAGAGFALARESTYTVTEVKVDTLAESAVKARDKAFGEAQTAAFKKLAERFYSPDELSGLGIPDAKTIAGMVQDFEVKNEQLSTKRYRGVYTFRFKAHAVERYFGRSAQYSAGQFDGATSGNQSGLLILPFFTYNGKTVLWDQQKNPWLQAWQRTTLTGNLSLVLPLGDVSDIMDVREEQGLTYNPAGLKRMRSRYEARDTAIIFAKFEQGSRKPLVIEVYRAVNKSPELYKTLEVPTNGAKTLGQLMTKGIAMTKEVLAERWRLETIVEDTEQVSEDVATPVAEPKPYVPMGGQARFVTRFTNINEWLAIRRSLTSIPTLTNVKIVSLKANQAVIDLSYSDWPSLNTGLNSRGLFVSSTGAGSYELGRQQAPIINSPYR